MEAYVAGRRVKLQPSQSVGQGGEAEVFRIGPGTVLKLWKPPEHPDFAALPAERAAAAQRIAVYAAKLRAFPAALPARVVRPLEPATDRTGRRVVGYTMRFVAGAEPLGRYADRGARPAGVGPDTVRDLLLDLHATVAALHASGVVIGDFNDLNVLVLGSEAHLIDADSFQFGPYPCTVYTARFVDPLLCDPGEGTPVPCRPHNPASDWYAYAVMLMQSLLFVGPYGGVFAPRDPARRVPHDARPLHRITVFHPEVRYPKPAVPWSVLPDDLLHQLHEVFEHDRRDEFPRGLVAALRWSACGGCGLEHARERCPTCARGIAAPLPLPLPIPLPAAAAAAIVRGTVTALELLATRGRILCAAWQDGRLRWLVHEGDQYRREDGRVVLAGPLDPQLRLRLRGDETLLARGGQLVRSAAGRPATRLAVDLAANDPAFDANAATACWLDQGRLMRDGAAGPEVVGEVLAAQTRLWVGPRLGFGFYRAADLRVGFLFSPDRNGLNDAVPLPPFRGQLVDAHAVFSDDRCWFCVATEEGGKIVRRCTLYRPDGSAVAGAESNGADSAWLAAVGGACAAGEALFVPQDEGIVRIEPQAGRLVRTREFPDTEPFVDAGCRLLPARDGLHVVRPQGILLLRLS